MERGRGEGREGGKEGDARGLLGLQACSITFSKLAGVDSEDGGGGRGGERVRENGRVGERVREDGGSRVERGGVERGGEGEGEGEGGAEGESEGEGEGVRARMLGCDGGVGRERKREFRNYSMEGGSGLSVESGWEGEEREEDGLEEGGGEGGRVGRAEIEQEDVGGEGRGEETTVRIHDPWWRKTLTNL
jgi:hypothetical protein